MNITKKRLVEIIKEEVELSKKPVMEEAHGHLPHAGTPQIPDLFRMADELGAIAQNTFNSRDAHILRKAEEILRARNDFSEGLTKKQADAARRRQQDAADKRAGLAPTEDVPGVDVKAMYRKQQKDIKAADRKRKARDKGKQK